MIYPKNNAFVISTNPHSLGLQNNMTTQPTLASPGTMVELATNKAFIGSGAKRAIPNNPQCKNWGGNMSIWR